MSVELTSADRVQALKSGIEAVTGEAYTDLTEGIQALKNGYGKGGGKEEQEKTIDITENGTTEVLPDDGKVLSKVTVNVEVESGGEDLASLETKIDESGVLDGTEQNIDEKVDTLIDRAESESLWYEQSKKWTAEFKYLFAWSAMKRLPRMSFQNATNLQQFAYQASGLETIDFYMDTAKATRLYQTFMHCHNLKSIVGINTSNATSVYELFKFCYALETIQEPLDFSKVTDDNNFTGVFIDCKKLATVRFVPNSIKKWIRVDSPVLSDESTQSAIDGLADMTGATAQSIIFHPTVTAKLTEAQIATITSKNWVVA